LLVFTGASAYVFTHDVLAIKQPKSLITPASYSRFIWLFINLLKLGYVAYQWSPDADDVVNRGVGWYFSIASLLHVAALAVYLNHESPILNCVLLLLVFLTTAKAYSNLEYYPPNNVFDRWFIHVLFSTYTAWSGIFTIILAWGSFPILNDTWPAVLAIAVIGLGGLHFVDFHKRHDVFVGGTVLWALVAIAFEHEDKLPIIFSASLAGGLVLRGILHIFIDNTCKYFHREEQAPLLP
jgi:hypothetical protein